MPRLQLRLSSSASDSESDPLGQSEVTNMARARMAKCQGIKHLLFSNNYGCKPSNSQYVLEFNKTEIHTSICTVSASPCSVTSVVAYKAMYLHSILAETVIQAQPGIPTNRAALLIFHGKEDNTFTVPKSELLHRRMSHSTRRVCIYHHATMCYGRQGRGGAEGEKAGQKAESCKRLNFKKIRLTEIPKH
ncbi:hypothetical protein EQH57_0135 [Dictyocoela roeselum]|nr:hypothetical protein EQH57_0135 [Dictyocoela roeselum]